MATDTEQKVREAIVTILNAHSGLETVMGRGTGVVVERGAIAPDNPLPMLAYDFLGYDEGSGRIEVLFSAVADGSGSGAKCRAMLEQVESALTWSAFDGQSVPVVPLSGDRKSVDEVGDLRGVFLRDGAPLIQQADWQVPLLYIT